jgi:hypothetical protein
MMALRSLMGMMAGYTPAHHPRHTVDSRYAVHQFYLSLSSPLRRLQTLNRLK